MRKKIQAVRASLVMFILLLSVIYILPTSVSAERHRILTFPSYIDISYDETILNEDLAIDKSINVPLSITYRTDIPANFGRFLPWQLRNIILFGSMIGPMQKLHIEIINAPSWADIYVSQADIFTSIPFKDSNEPPVNTSLVISPREEAPAVPQSITIKVSCESIGRITGQEREIQISFTPKFVPTLMINVENPIREVGPHQPINFKITVENTGNKKARVFPEIKDADSRWTPTINPPHLDVEPGTKGEFAFSIYTPYNFGWHNEREQFDLEFTYKIFPIREDAPVGGPDLISLTVTNYGFSTPGFEFITLIAAIVIAGILIKKRYTK